MAGVDAKKSGGLPPSYSKPSLKPCRWVPSSPPFRCWQRLPDFQACWSSLLLAFGPGECPSSILKR